MTAALTRVALRRALHRITCAAVAAELRRLRGPDLPLVHDWPEDMPIGDEGLGLDSLEQLGALGALAETFALDDAVLGTEPPRMVGAWVDWAMRRHGSGDGYVNVETSGSTGQPKSCRHRMSDLIEEAETFAAHIPARRRVVALVPANHLYGMVWTAILPAVTGVPVVARTLGASLDLAPGDLVVAVPEQWQAIRRLVRRFPADVVGVSSAGQLDATCADGLLAAGLAHLFDIYGASETGGIAMREWPATSYALLPRWHLVPHGADDWHLGDECGARHELPDRIDRIGERGVRPLGRRDHAVQVGGHNVRPAQVADVLRTIEGVADAAVRLDAGGRLKAFIVPEGAADPAQLAIEIDCVSSQRLSAPERPRSVRFGRALPRNPMGKLEDWT